MRLDISATVATLVGLIIASGASDPCISLCEGMDSCRNDPDAHSSYCKVGSPISVCFGFYWMNSNMSEMCYFPNDPGCTEEMPVKCTPSSDMSNDSTDPGTTTDSGPSTEAPAVTNAEPASSAARPVLKTEEVADTPGPVGTYCSGSPIHGGTSLVLVFSGNLTMSMAGWYTGATQGLEYSYHPESNEIAVTNESGFTQFLTQVSPGPPALRPEDVSMIYNAESNSVAVTILQQTHTALPCD